MLPLKKSSSFEYKKGNYLKLVELFRKFELVLGEHIKQTTIGKNKHHHCVRKSIQNEIIQTLQDQKIKSCHY